MRIVLPLLAIIALGAGGCATGDRTLFPARPDEPKCRVWIVNHSALHTGLALKRAEIPRGVWPANQDYSPNRYLEVGWGDDDGYRRDLTTGITLKALVRSTRTVMLFDGFDCSLRENFKGAEYRIVEVELSKRGFDRLCHFIAETHALDSRGRPIPLGSDWYRGKGTYKLTHTCNTWVAEALQRAGCPIAPCWCIMPGPLLKQARRFGRPLQ